MPALLDQHARRAVPSPKTPPATTAFVITVDTEPDDAWTDHQNPSVRNVAVVRRLRELLDRYDAFATLLITTRVVENAEACAALELCAAAGDEIGTHLHPWESPPFLNSGLDTRFPAFPHELPQDAFVEKLTILTAAIAARFGPPTSYRAGRWGFMAAHLRPLEALGYIAETSVIPWIDWSATIGIPHGEGGRGGVDYRTAPRDPYHPAYDDATRPGGAQLVELPVTVGFTRRVPRFVEQSYGRLPYIAQRILRKTELVRPVWATPPEEPAARLEHMLRNVLACRPPLVNVALHSSELWPGGAPHVRTAAEADSVFARLELLLRVAAEDGRCQFMTLTNAAHGWIANDDSR